MLGLQDSEVRAFVAAIVDEGPTRLVGEVWDDDGEAEGVGGRCRLT